MRSARRRAKQSWPSGCGIGKNDARDLFDEEIRRRWRVVRLFAWLQNDRGLVRYERHAGNFLAFLHLASSCSTIDEMTSSFAS
jgi:transposase